MCNCNPISACNSCQRGVPCNCPPLYPIPNQTVPCTCCPPGYIFYTDSVFPNGICKGPQGNSAPIPCVVCEESFTTDCVTYSATIPLTCNPSGIAAGDSLTTILNKMCFTNPVNISALLTTISNSQTLLNGLCSLVAACGVTPGTTVPVIGTISWTTP